MSKFRTLIENIINENNMHTIYMILDRYEHAEFYHIFGDGIYTDLNKATEDYKKELKDFQAFGPDDCHTFMLVQFNLEDVDLAKLQEHYNKYLANSDDYAYDEDFTDFMENLVRAGKELAFWTI